MFGKRIRLFSLLGFEVRVDASWIIIFLLIAWSLSNALYPFYYGDLTSFDYWMMGFLVTGLFLSIIVHEFCHSLVARSYGIPMTGITLFIFGGVAEMSDEPSSYGSEFFMAIVGPLSSVGLGALLYGIELAGASVGWPLPVRGVILYLSGINIILALFNLIPAFPLDGGRVLRSALWRLKGDVKWATKVASNIGSGFGLLLILFGILAVISGDFVGGLWWFLIGIFLRNAAQMSYRQIIIRRAFEGEKVKKFMIKDPVTVNPSLSLGQLVNDYVFKYHFKMFPVVNENNPVGCVTVRQVEGYP